MLSAAAECYARFSGGNRSRHGIILGHDILKNMSKTIWIIACVIVLLVVFGMTARVSYWLGQRHISELVLHSGVLDGKVDSPPPDTSNDGNNG